MKTQFKLTMMAAILMMITSCSFGTLKSDIQSQQDEITTTSSRPISNKVILDWNEHALNTVRQGKLETAVAGRIYAMVNVAIYDAVNGIDVAEGFSKQEHALVAPFKSELFFFLGRDAPKNASRHAAATAAAYTVLSKLHPENQAIYKTQLIADLADSGDRQWALKGEEWGVYVGKKVVAKRSNDGSLPELIISGKKKIGIFRKDFPSAQYANLKPFAISDPVKYRSPGPPALNSPEYAKAFNEVKRLGNSAFPDKDKESLFMFWKGGKGSSRPPGEWMKVAMLLAENKALSISSTAKLFALLGMAMGDTVAVGWDNKRHFMHWRPADAIRNADADGNPATEQDAEWVPRNGSTGSAPEHFSGTACFAGAGSTILKGFFSSDNISFTFEGDNAVAGPKTFNSFSEAAAEAGRARIYAGIHFEFSIQGGQKAGRDLANEILLTKLK